MATMEVEKTVAVLSERVYSLSIDGGSKRLSKTYPILVYGFDPTQERIVWKMLNVGTLHIEDRATGENIFALLSDAVVSNAFSWERCLALSVDNANVMSGDKKGFFGRLCNMQPACHLSGCVCHLLSLTAQVGSAEMNYDVNNLLQDIWHYRDKSNVRQGSLHKIQGENAKKMLRNAPSRWLDLGRHCPRLLSEWDSLKQLVKEEKVAASQKEGSKAVNEEVEAQRRTQKTRLARIKECLNSRECKLVVLFLDYVMAELFDPVNKHFQSAEPLIATARRFPEGFIRKLLSGFVQPAHTRSALPSAVQHSPRSHQKPDSDLLVPGGWWSSELSFKTWGSGFLRKDRRKETTKNGKRAGPQDQVLCHSTRILYEGHCLCQKELACSQPCPRPCWGSGHNSKRCCKIQQHWLLREALPSHAPIGVQTAGPAAGIRGVPGTWQQWTPSDSSGE